MSARTAILGNRSILRPVTMLLGLFLFLSAAHIWTKAPWIDELFYASPGLDLITRGSFGVPVLEPTGCVTLPGGTVYSGVNHHVYVPAVLHFLLSAPWYKIAGFSIITIRLYALLWGLIFLGACYVILKNLSGRSFVALCGVTFVAFSHIFVNSATDGRPDIVCAALGVAGVAAYLLLRERRIALAVFASHGLLAGAAAVHPAAFLYLVAVLLITVYYDFKRLRIQHVLIAAIPYLVMFGGWALLLLGDWDTAAAQFRIMFGQRAGTRTNVPGMLWNEWVHRYWGAYAPLDNSTGSRLKFVLLIFYPLGLVGGAAAARQHPQYRPLVWLGLASCLTLPFLDVYGMSYYLVHTVPWICMLLGVWLVTLWDRGGALRRVAVGVAALFLVLNVGWTVYNIRRDPHHREFADAARVAREQAGPTDLVTGPLEMGLVFGFYNNLVDDSTLGYYTGRKAQVIIVDERGYGQAFSRYPVTTPDVGRHIASLLDGEYTLVLQNRLYRVYARKKSL